MGVPWHCLCTVSTASFFFALMPIIASLAPTASFARSIPRTSSAARSSITTASLCRRGSHSAPFAIMVSAVDASLTWAGNPPPPAPTTPARRTCSARLFCCIRLSLAVHRIEHCDDVCRRHIRHHVVHLLEHEPASRPHDLDLAANVIPYLLTLPVDQHVPCVAAAAPKGDAAAKVAFQCDRFHSPTGDLHGVDAVQPDFDQIVQQL